MTRGRVVITGIGVAGPLGLGRAALDAALDAGLVPTSLGEIRLEDYLDTEKTYLDPNSRLTLCATALALADAGLPLVAETPGVVGMSFGTRLGNVTTTESYMKGVREQGVKLASPLLFIHAYPNTSVSLAAIEFGIKGTNSNFNTGRSSSLQALVQSADVLRRGRMSVMLAGSADTYTDVTRTDALGVPFRGAVTFVTERAVDAMARGARPTVEIAGGGMAGTIKGAFSQALAEASLGRPEVDWVLVDGAVDDDFRVHTTDLLKTVGDCGSATASLGVALAALAIAGGKRPVGLGLPEAPRTAAVVSVDDAGAAAVILHGLTD